MPENLYAACRVKQELSIKRVQLDGTIQEQVEGIFSQQAHSFFNNIEEEVAFDGSWKPDDNQLFTVEVPHETALFVQALEQNVVSIPPVDTTNFAAEGIKALFAGEVQNGSIRILVQRFTQAQVLSRRIVFVEAGNVFRRLIDPAFALDSSLTCVIESGMLKFKSFEKLRTIIDTTEIHRAATDSEVSEFAGHASFAVDDVDRFVESADSRTRKLISAITASGILQDCTSAEIQMAAEATQLTIAVQDGKIVLPAESPKRLEILQFLNESRYSGPLSGLPYVTNSRRRV